MKSAAPHRPRQDAASWRWQLGRRLRSPEALAAFLGRPAPRRTAGVDAALQAWPMAVTPYYASLIRRLTRADPIVRLVLADAAEALDTDGMDDPFDETGRMPVPGLVRRYRDRAALIATTDCAVRCRHCTRRNELTGRAGRPASTAADPAAAAAWLRRHPEVREVLVTGGDPLVLSTAKLEAILGTLRAVPSIDILRIGTRAPVVLPQRIDRALCAMLRRHHPLWLNTHFNHPAELTPQAATACARLADAGIPVGNQTVLLRGVNDSVRTLESLFRGLLKMRARPYYLLQCDPVRGAAHFRVPLRRALALVDELRARLSGLAVPVLVVDAAGGAGKIPLSPTGVLRWTRGGAILRGPRGRTAEWRDADGD